LPRSLRALGCPTSLDSPRCFDAQSVIRQPWRAGKCKHASCRGPVATAIAGAQPRLAEVALQRGVRRLSQRLLRRKLYSRLGPLADSGLAPKRTFASCACGWGPLILRIERQSLYGSSCTIFSSRSANSFRRSSSPLISCNVDAMPRLNASTSPRIESMTKCSTSLVSATGRNSSP
jgi:hypothetical protein